LDSVETMGEVQSGRLSTLLIDLEGGFARGVQRPLRCSLVDIVRESTEDMQSPLASSIIHTAGTCLMGIEDLTGIHLWDCRQDVPQARASRFASIRWLLCA
jgi:hypothetical protein